MSPARAFNSSLELDKVLETVLEKLRSLIDVLGSTVWLMDPKSEKLVCRQAAGICCRCSERLASGTGAGAGRLGRPPRGTP